MKKDIHIQSRTLFAEYELDKKLKTEYEGTLWINCITKTLKSLLNIIDRILHFLDKLDKKLRFIRSS